MKRFTILAAALVALAVTAHGSFAQTFTPITVPLKWDRGISSYGLGVKDSLVISLPGPAAAVDFADTTVWLDLGSFKFPQQAYTAYPLVTFSVYGQANTASDSIGYAVQYADQISVPGGNYQGITNVFTSATVAYLSLSASTTVGANNWGNIVAVAPTSSVYNHRFVRLVILNAEVGGTIGRRYCGVTAVVNGSR